MKTSIQDPSRTLLRTDSAAQMHGPQSAAKVAKSQAGRTSNGPRGGKNDSAYEGPKADSLTQAQRHKIDFLIRQGEHDLDQLEPHLTQAMQRSTASVYRDGAATAVRDALTHRKGLISNRLHNLRALRAGHQLPALQDAIGLAKAALDLAGPHAAPRAQYDAVLKAAAQHAAEK